MKNEKLKVKFKIKSYGNFKLLIAIFNFSLLIFNLIAPVLAATSPAPVVISKIAAYEKDEYRWVEIVNRSDRPVDTTGWKFWENGANHGWKLAQGNDLILDAGELAVIVSDKDKFLEKHSDYTGTIIDSVWSAPKDKIGDEIGIKKSKDEEEEVFHFPPYSGGVLERLDINLDDYSVSNWKEIKDGKDGEEGEEERDGEEEIEEIDGKEGEEGEPVISENPFPIREDPSLNQPPIAIIGDDLEINVGDTVFFDGSDSFDADGDALEYFWDFGDGGEGEGVQIEHRYEHQGKFSAILRVSDGKLAASNAIWVNVVKIDYPEGIYINSFLVNPAGPDTDSEYVEVCNGGAELADLSGWILDDIADGGSKEYKIKSSVEIDADECVKFYRKETKIALNNNGDSVRLLNPGKGVEDSVEYDKTVKDEEILYSQKSVKSVKSKVGDENNELEIKEIRETKETVETGEITTPPLVDDTSTYHLQEAPHSDSVDLPAAVRTADVYCGTLDGEMVKIAGVVGDKSGNVFFVDDGSGAARVWVSPKSKIDYASIVVGGETIVTGVVSKTEVGWRVKAENTNINE